MARGVVLGLLSLLVGACAPATGLTVDVRTDFEPAFEFTSVQTEISATAFASPMAEGMIVSRAAGTSDFVAGVRVAERPDLASGDWFVRVTLLASSGARVTQRTVAVHLSGRRALTVVLARSCAAVTCPMPSAPTLSECSGGTCVSPMCSAETPEACPSPECRSDSDCTPPGPCARPSCAAGVCLFDAADSLCAGGGCGGDYQCHGAADAGHVEDAGSDAGSDAGTDAAMPIDAFTPGPSFVLQRLPRPGSAWSTVTTTGMVPTDPIEAAFAQLATDEMMVLTHTELFVLRLSTLTFTERHPRDTIFPSIAGITVQGATIVDHEIFLHAHDAWLFTWSNATRSATLDETVLYADRGADWHGALAPPWFTLYEMFYVPDNADGWAHADPRMVCGTSTVNNHITYLSWDGFGPAAMIVTVYDAGCGQFVDQSVYGSAEYTAFSLPGAPPLPFKIVGAEWYDGLWAFSAAH